MCSLSHRPACSRTLSECSQVAFLFSAFVNIIHFGVFLLPNVLTPGVTFSRDEVQKNSLSLVAYIVVSSLNVKKTSYVKRSVLIGREAGQMEANCRRRTGKASGAAL